MIVILGVIPASWRRPEEVEQDEDSGTEEEGE
jgi:hypothetical protein